MAYPRKTLLQLVLSVEVTSSESSPLQRQGGPLAVINRVTTPITQLFSAIYRGDNSICNYKKHSLLLSCEPNEWINTVVGGWSNLRIFRNGVFTTKPTLNILLSAKDTGFHKSKAKVKWPAETKLLVGLPLGEKNVGLFRWFGYQTKSWNLSKISGLYKFYWNIFGQISDFEHKVMEVFFQMIYFFQIFEVPCYFSGMYLDILHSLKRRQRDQKCNPVVAQKLFGGQVAPGLLLDIVHKWLRIYICR